MKLTIIIPIHNEERTILKILNRVKNADSLGLKKEIILIDDFSTDGTRDILRKIKDKNIIKIYLDKNRGKGFAIRKGLENSTGEIILIQDADLEYNPHNYPRLIKPILDNKFSVVYGSRFLNRKNKKQKLSFYLGNRFLSTIVSILYFKKITDMETCYKVFKKEIIKDINLQSNRFEIEPEITSKLFKNKIDIIEVPIDYFPRSKQEGKKIKWRDGFIAIWTLIKYRFTD